MFPFVPFVPLQLFMYLLGYCPRAGLFARFCHRLAGPRFGNPSRFSRFLRFAKPRNTERTLRWLAEFHVSL